MARESSPAPWDVRMGICALAILLPLALAITGCSLSNRPNPADETKQHAVTLSWTASPSKVAGYNVYRGSASGGPYTRVNSVLEAATHYVDDTVTPGTIYFYAVAAEDASGIESYFSNEVSVIIPSP